MDFTPDWASLILALISTGFDKLEAFTSVLLYVMIPVEVERIADKRFLEIQKACEILDKCNIPSELPVLMKLGLATDKLVKTIASKLTISRSYAYILGGAFAGLIVSAAQPIKVVNVLKSQPSKNLGDQYKCLEIWRGHLDNNNYAVYWYSDNDEMISNCTSIDIVCIELESLGRMCLNSQVLKTWGTKKSEQNY